MILRDDVVGEDGDVAAGIALSGNGEVTAERQESAREQASAVRSDTQLSELVTERVEEDLKEGVDLKREGRGSAQSEITPHHISTHILGSSIGRPHSLVTLVGVRVPHTDGL